MRNMIVNYTKEIFEELINIKTIDRNRYIGNNIGRTSTLGGINNG